ncbi:MAG: TetR/AcrR family transcriptional regulator [Lentisphaeria bacterium]|nr:TetR/AcrR family transcriptional regulator [Lentisphaeria bacterium]
MKKDQSKRQNEILDAALHLIAEKGIKNLTIRHLSQAMHITDAALYYYFQDKLAIIQALVSRFEGEADAVEDELHGWAAVEAALIHRTELVLATPDLARVVFAEELFQGDPEVEQILFGMMQRHRKIMLRHFKEAEDAGEIRSDIPDDTLFRMILGPLRLLIKQWGMSHGAFDLRKERQKLLDGLRIVLKQP